MVFTPCAAPALPTPPERVPALLADLERFIHDDAQALPPLVKTALVHLQFETIPPFLDGNGRIGRLLMAALLEHWGLLAEPRMYLSGYLKQHQAEDYRRLSNVRTEGDWEGWVAFFLEGVAMDAQDAERGIVAIAPLLAADRRRLLASPKAGPATKGAARRAATSFGWSTGPCRRPTTGWRPTSFPSVAPAHAPARHHLVCQRPAAGAAGTQEPGRP